MVEVSEIETSREAVQDISILASHPAGLVLLRSRVLITGPKHNRSPKAMQEYWPVPSALQTGSGGQQRLRSALLTVFYGKNEVMTANQSTLFSQSGEARSEFRPILLEPHNSKHLGQHTILLHGCVKANLMGAFREALAGQAPRVQSLEIMMVLDSDAEYMVGNGGVGLLVSIYREKRLQQKPRYVAYTYCGRYTELLQ